jgi:hypothetical protein
LTPRDEYWRIEAYRERLKHSLAARFLLRYHVSLILAASITSAVSTDLALLGAGVRAMIVRYPLAIVAGYAAFYAGIAAWLRYSGIREYLDRTRAEELIGDDVKVPPWRESSVDPGDILGAAAAPEGCLWIAGFVALFFIFGGYALVAAPTLFADVVLELFIAAGLLRGVRRAEGGGWMRGAWANSWPTLAASLFVALLLGAMALNTSPRSSTLQELWQAIRHPGARR